MGNCWWDVSDCCSANGDRSLLEGKENYARFDWDFRRFVGDGAL
ncbi:MAG: hypothetical protein AAF961_00860 [Planctomycetota bacterium]